MWEGQVTKGGGSIHIDRPAEEVFAFVADAENNPRWRSYVVETAWLDDGPMRVGRQGRQVSKVLGRPMAVVAEIAEWDPPRHVAWRAVAGFASVRTDCTVEPENGGCRLTISAEGEFKSRILRLLSPLAIGVAKRQADADVQKLKAALESRTEQNL
jgi:carbon monoxide dehydrogenase subunit G